MMSRRLKIVFLGLSLSSSWGNGHATTFRALLRGLHSLSHELTFLERDVPWYLANRDLQEADFCDLRYYRSVSDLHDEHRSVLNQADVIVVGSFVPEGVAVIEAAASLCTATLCFYDIDTPVTMTKLASRDHEYLADHQIPLFDIYFSFTGGPTLERLCTQFRARRAEALYCSVDPTRYAPTSEELAWDLGYLGTYSPDRQPTLERLLIDVAARMPDRRFVVAGPQYPADVSWPDNVERIAHLPPSEHAAFYSRQRHTLNVTRADMIAAGWSPSVRLFEAAACACPVVSDRWRGLEEIFPIGEAIHVADTADDVCELLSANDEARRQKVARRARDIVLASHTGEARAREFISCITSSSRQDPNMDSRAA